jgi:putative nucleotidyltransferase with HDIG domain
MNWQPDARPVRALIEAMLDEVETVYVVGGVVRDALLGRQLKQTDLDLVVPNEALPVARRVADRLGWAFYPLDEARDVGRVIFSANHGEPYVCDVARMRGATIEEDLRARDFTVNAMAFAIDTPGHATLIDVTGGEADLAAGLLRRVGPTSLADDPLRLLRAVRFIVELGLDVEPETAEQIKRMAATVKLTTPERQRDELWKTLSGSDPEQALVIMQSLGLLPFLLPELDGTVDVAQSFPHYTDVFNHTLLVVRNAALIRDWIQAAVVEDPPATMWQATLMPWRNELRRQFLKPLSSGRSHVDWLVWHALFHDVGKPETRSVEIDADGGTRYHFYGHETLGAAMTATRLDALRFGRNEITLAETVVDAHMRPHHLDASFTHEGISRRAIYRFYRDVRCPQVEDPAGVDALLLALADYQAIHEAAVPPRWDEYLEHVGQLLAYAYADDGLNRTRVAPLLDGHVLLAELDLTPGPMVGQLLEAVAEAQAAGEVKTQADALALAKSQLAREP